MSTLNDAIEILLLEGEDDIDSFYGKLQNELEKYKKKPKEIKS